jgi:hypothetical protein
MRAQRIKIGFRRLGLALAGGCVIVTALNAFFGDPPQAIPRDTDHWFFAWLIGSVVAYPVTWAIGWIAADPASASIA